MEQKSKPLKRISHLKKYFILKYHNLKFSKNVAHSHLIPIPLSGTATVPTSWQH
jgi:hypothetical protein